MHRVKYSIPMTQKDHMSTLDMIGNDTVQVRLDPTAAGNCQFDSVADQLQDCGIHRSEIALRREAVDYIRSYVEDYRAFIAGNPDIYLARMERNSEYGDHITLLDLACEYNVVVSSDGQLDDRRMTLTLGHFPEHHYVSVSVTHETLNALRHHMVPPNDEVDNEHLHAEGPIGRNGVQQRAPRDTEKNSSEEYDEDGVEIQNLEDSDEYASEKQSAEDSSSEEYDEDGVEIQSLEDSDEDASKKQSAEDSDEDASKKQSAEGSDEDASEKQSAEGSHNRTNDHL